MRKLGTWLRENTWIMLPLMVLNGLLFGSKLFWHLTMGQAAILGGLAAILTGEIPYGGRRASRRSTRMATGSTAYISGGALLAFGVALIVRCMWGFR